MGSYFAYYNIALLSLISYLFYMSKVKTLQLQVDGMHCAGCATGIEKDLSGLKGIIRINVNFALGTASIDYEPEHLEEKTITDKIVELGYLPKKNVKQKISNIDEAIFARRSFLSALIFTLPVMLVSMSGTLFDLRVFSQQITGLFLLILSLPVLFYGGRGIFIDAWAQTKRFRANKNSLIALGSLTAYLFSCYVVLDVFIMKKIVTPQFYFETSAMIITVILLGRFLEARAKGRDLDAIGSLLKLRPGKAIAVINGQETEIPVSKIIKGTIIIVRPGDKIPADGFITEGEPSINEAMLTSESLPVNKKKGDQVIGGSINGNSSFKFEVSGVGEDTFLAGIIRLVTEAQNRKAPVQKVADKIAGIFVPIVLLIAAVTFAIWYLLDPNSAMLLKAPVAVLIVACPCALGLATPTAILAGIGRAARHGIYIRGGDILENTVKTNQIVFDKTGTLTIGRFEVTATRAVDEKKEEELLKLAASAESGSTHPLAKAIVEKAVSMQIELESPKNLVEFPGFGIKAEFDGLAVILGSGATMRQEKVDLSSFIEAAEEEMDSGRTVVYVASNGQALGFLALADAIKEEAVEVVDRIKKAGREVIMLTGDNFKTAAGVASTLGIDRYEATVKPDQKAVIIETLRRADYNVMMVGDGIDDAPALASANVGVALGSGTNVAMESADIILVRNDLNSLIEALNISHLTLRTIKQNLFWAVFYNIIAIPLAAGVFYPVLGWSLSPVIAAAAMAFSSLFVISNSLRLLQVKRGE